MQNQKTENTFVKKIGKAIYQVNIHFSEVSKDTFGDKLFRVIKNDIAENPKEN